MPTELDSGDTINAAAAQPKGWAKIWARAGLDLSAEAVREIAPVGPRLAGKSASIHRGDIDGLRAIAVLPVVLYHLGMTWIPGGFTGVDVFFVISGFLITGIVKREIDDGRFSVARFYERRIRRIYPALLVMLAGVVAAGLLLYTPDDLRDLGASLAATVGFGSNILFWLQTDYFAGAAELKPLLHTWSLAVEEQYYIILPPLMWVLNRFAPKHLKSAIVGLALASFALSCAWLFVDKSGDFYLPHTRAWELLIGSMLALGVVPEVRNHALRQALSVAGLVLVLGTFFVLTDAMPFPGWTALPTCIGAGLLLHTGRQGDTVASKLLSFTPLVWIGLISYSIYLIHWPLIVFSRYQLMHEPTLLEKTGLLVLTVALAWFSWRFVERPFRDRQKIKMKWIFTGAAVGSGLMLVVGTAAFATQGLPQRFGDRAMMAKTDDEQQKSTVHCFLKGGFSDWAGDRCFLTSGTGPVVLLWGDSHANHYAPSIRDADDLIDSRVLMLASAGCPPLFDITIKGRKDCRANNAQVPDLIKRYGVRRVVLSSYWERIFKDNRIEMAAFTRTVQKLQAMGVKVTVIGDGPDFPFANPAFLALRLAKRPNPNAPFYTETRNDFGFNARLRAAAGPVAFYDPMPKLCRGEQCMAFKDGQSLMTDNSHLSKVGANLLITDLAREIDAPL